MKFTKQFITLILAMVFTAQSFAAEVSPKREVRSVWLTTVWCIDWPSVTGTSASIIASQQSSLISMIEDLHENNFNAIYFQVRSMCDAMYNSSYEPWSSYLTGARGTDPGWDPLEFAVEECHKRGMECHAWVNPYRYSTGSVWTTDQDKALEASGILLTSGTTTILNPAYEESRERIVNVCREIAINYDVDGIVFDDYFYPDGISAGSSADDYSDWQSSGTSLTFANWRRNNVNQMVEDVYNMIQSVKPWIRFGISPAGVAGTAATSAGVYGVTPCPTGSDWQYNGIYSDPLAWLCDGTVDYVSPQLYWVTTHSTNPFGTLTDWWSYVANYFNRHHYASHAIYSNTNTTAFHSEIALQVQYSRDYTENDAPGAVFYSTKYIVGDVTSTGGALANYIKENKFQYPALTPTITWKDFDSFPAVSNLTQNGSTLTWDAVTGTGIIKYAVYQIPISVTGTNEYESTYLKGVTYTNEYTLDSDQNADYWFAVTVVDGYGNEFDAATISGTSDVKGLVDTEAIRITATTNAVTFSQIIDKAELYSTNGQLIAVATNSANMQINLAKGTIYILRTTYNNNITTEKILIQ